MSELINRARRYIDLWDKTTCVEIEVLTGMVDARDAYYAAPDLVCELVAEIERLEGSRVKERQMRNTARGAAFPG